MLHDYDKYNYWRIELDELPSRGRFYPTGAKIKIRSMSVLEIKFLATLMPQTATQVCNELLEKCTILENMQYDDLLLPDRQYLIFWIRLNSFSSKTGYTVTIPRCSGCGERIEKTIRLEELQFRHLDHDFEPVVHLLDYGDDIRIAIPKYRDSVLPVEDELGELALYMDMPGMSFYEKYEFIKEMSAMDYITLKSAIDRNSCGIATETVVSCDICHKAHTVQLAVNDSNLFSPINIMEVLETITRICKYSNLQITNDWPWIEVEVENEIINKMIREENEQNQKEIAAAKARASSVGHVPHI